MRNFITFLLVIIVLVSCKEDKNLAEGVSEIENTVFEEPVVVKQYGFNLDDFTVVQDTVAKNETFGELMTNNKVDYPKIYNVSEKFKDSFDVRRFRAGKPYLILKSKDTLETTQVFIYQNDKINYTVIDFRDSVNVFKGRKKIKYVEREASGTISTFLSEAILEQGIDYNISVNLSEIYAWSIDFFRLQKGDKFKVIYKEKFINDSIYAGCGPIEAAYFEHNGKPFYAFEYQTDSLKQIVDYYDHEANNLRRAFLKAPVKFSRISSRYNLKRRIKYYGYKVRPHRGTDYAAAIGTPIIATANGTVVESTRRGGNGKYVKIRHNGTYSTQYLHMKNRNVKKGDHVLQGDVIGWVGMTGNTGGPHVCYRFWKNGVQVDPLREKLPVSEPMADTLKLAYFDYIAPKLEQLKQMNYPIVPVKDTITDIEFE